MERTPENNEHQDLEVSSEPESPPTLGATKTDNTMPMLCHLLALTAVLGVPFGHIIGPLIIWLIKKDADPRVDRCGRESLNFQITVSLIGIALFLIAAPIAIIPVVGPLLLPIIVLAGMALAIAALILTVIATIQTGAGVAYSYPFALRLLK